MKIGKAKNKVFDLLTSTPRLRDNDNKLIASVWLKETKELGLDVQYTTAFDLLKCIADGKLTSSESIRRTRCKIQETTPSLRGTKYEDRHKAAVVVKQEIKNWSN